MDSAPKAAMNLQTASSLFDVYLRLRPALRSGCDRYLDVEPPTSEVYPKHITIKPPANDHRKRAVEKFAFTRVFEEQASQLDIFDGTGVLSLLEGVLGSEGRTRDGLLATLGVTGSGKSHTILGSKTQRGLTQMALDVLVQSISSNMVHPTCVNSVFPSLAASDVSEADMLLAPSFIDSIWGEGQPMRGSMSRAQTPLLDTSYLSIPTIPTIKWHHQKPPRISNLPCSPSVESIKAQIDPSFEYVLVISMYEVYNDRIFDLLAGQVCTTTTRMGTPRRRALLFKSTEISPHRKVVAGLRKIVCCTLEEALIVLEAGLLERKVAGTGSNAVSSRSHGFFCVEVKKRHRVHKARWESSTMTIVDLAGSERARTAKTAGATLAEAGKINESLMYLGQCMQMQSDSNSNDSGNKHVVVPFRQCKLTELLFSNSFPSASASQHHQQHSLPNPQKAIMIVTADPAGDFNATSQILRYSALAREITVPRIPSVTSTILSQTNSYPNRPGSSSSNSHYSSQTSEEALAEVARLNDALEILSLSLESERTRREAAEQSWLAAEEKLSNVEEEIREECFASFEEMLHLEKRRWEAAWLNDREEGAGVLDRKIEILEKTMSSNESSVEIHVDKEKHTLNEGALDVQSMENLLGENETLKAKLAEMEKRMTLRTPSGTGKKQRVLKAKKWETENIFESP